MLFSDNFNPCSYVPDSEKKYIKELTVWIFSIIHLYTCTGEETNTNFL